MMECEAAEEDEPAAPDAATSADAAGGGSLGLVATTPVWPPAAPPPPALFLAELLRERKFERPPKDARLELLLSELSVRRKRLLKSWK